MQLEESRVLSFTAAKPQVVQASSCGKAIIIGEHAVIYGAKAVAIPVHTMSMNITLKPGKPGERSRLKLGHTPVSEHVLGVLDDAYAALGLEPYPIRIEGSSSVLIGSGLGSSAALSVVLLRALAKAYQKKLTVAELAALARGLEQRFHGPSSGLDTAVVAYQQALVFLKARGATLLSIEAPRGAPSWRFVLIDSGVRSSTLAMVKQAAPFFQDRRLGQMRTERFDALASLVTEGLQHGGFDLVVAGMREASELLAQAGLVTAPLQAILEVAAKLGIPAAKLTGAGGGGCVIGLLDPFLAEKQVLQLKEVFGETKVFLVELS